MRHLQGGVADFAGLLTENGAEQTLLGSEIGLALGGDLAHQDITGGDLGTHHDDTALVQVLQRIVAHAGDVPGDLLGSQLGVAGVALILFHVDGGENVLHDQALVEQDGVFVVVAFPVHVAHQDVLAQGDLAVGGTGAVSHDVALLDALTGRDDGPLVDAGALVGAGKLDKLVVLYFTGVIAHGDVVGVDPGDNAVILGQDTDAGVHSALVLDASGDDGRLSGHQRHGLTLHVCAHQGTVGVVVLQEGDHGGGDGDHHLGADVHIVHVFPVYFHGIVAVTAGDALVDDDAVLVHRLAGLGDDILVLLIGGHILDLVGQAAGALLHFPIGSHQEAVLIGTGVGGQVVDQADVGTFRGLNGAEAAVVAVVHVSHIEAGALAA